MKTRLFATASIALLMAVASAQTYTYYDLGSNFTPNNISATTGYIVGKTPSPQGDGNKRDAYVTFTYVAGSTAISAVQLVPLLSGSSYQDASTPTSINDSGDIVGIALTQPYGYEWNLIDGGSPVQLPGAGTPNETYALALNNNGYIAGQIISSPAVSLYGAIWASATSSPTVVADPYRYQGNFQCKFYAINNSEHCLAFVNINEGNGYADSWYDGTNFTLLASGTTATALNDTDQIVGTYSHVTNPSPQSTYNPTACIWTSPSAAPTALDDATQWSSTAYAINSSQTVVGSLSVTGNGMPQAFAWTSGAGMVNLNASGVVSGGLPIGVTLQSGLAIDNFGDIVGTSQVTVNHAPQTHAFLLVPSTGGA